MKMHKFRLTIAFAVFSCLAGAQVPPAQRPAGTPAAAPVLPTPQPGAAYVREHYTKYEYEIPMRDGVKLFTSVYVPKDFVQQYPIMLTRTPYSVAPYGVDKYRPSLGPSEKFARDGFIFVYQDVRGRYMSQGQFVEMTPHKEGKRGPKDIDESTDAYDTIDWLVKNIPNNNGKVGLYGTSYPGFFVSASMIDSHPALKAAAPAAPMTDLYHGDDSYHGGAFMLAANFGFYTAFSKHAEPTLPETRTPFDYKTPNGYDYFLGLGSLANLDEKGLQNKNSYFTDQVKHTTYDEFWKSRNLQPHLKNVKAAVMVVGGWFDAEDLAGPVKVYNAVKEYNPNTPATLVEGPWFHGGWARSDGERLGNVSFASKTSEFYRDNIEFPFFSYYLKGKGDGKLPGAYAFETGTNVWRKLDAWPPSGVTPRKLYFEAAGKLGFAPPKEKQDAFDEYISDPNKPVPFVPYESQAVPREYMTDDQRFAATRTDVLVYETEALTQDLTIAGPIQCDLNVSTSGTDSDFVVKVIDVYPNDYPDNDPNPKGIKMGGYQQLLRGEPFRGKFRNSFEKPEPFTPGKAAAIHFEMPDVFHTFRKGHRVMVQVQSSWFPLVDRNPQKFMDIPNARPQDFVKATERIYRTSAMPSAIVVNVKQ
jgi:putative CocE/NonD family hydrolase